jgi:NitT/TauT family transport system permease protein
MTEELRIATAGTARRQHVTGAARPSAAASVLLPLVAATALLIVWHLAVRLTGTKIFPSPLAVAKGVRDLPHLPAYIGDSLFRVGCGYLTAVLLGVPVGLALRWRARPIR